MTPFRNRLKTPEEIELEVKYQQLAAVKAELQRYEQVYANLKTEIRMFEQVYEDILGVRIETLEDLEWQLKGLLGEAVAERVVNNDGDPAGYSHFHHTTDLLDDDEPIQQDVANLSLKSLYRSVAKAVHPDLAADESERLRRQELMALANEAYQSGNRQVLIDLLSEWEQAPVTYGTEVDIALELVRVIRQVAAVQQNIHAVIRQTEELKQTDIYHFKVRVDEALADGIDLLAEMAAKVDVDIDRLRRRLATARGDEQENSGQSVLPQETRLLRFPVDQNCGMLYVRKSTSVDFRDWQRLGPAKGLREIFCDSSVRLDLKAEKNFDAGFLDGLQADDIQALFLYNCTDEILAQIAHLTGLQELYLSDSSVSDEALKTLRPLESLQRISIYHTPVSDDGIINLALIKGLKWLTCSGTLITEGGFELFRRVMPGCKTVSFKWRYQE